MNPNDLYLCVARNGWTVWTLKELRELNLPVLTIHSPLRQKGSCRCTVRPEGFGSPIVPNEGFTCVADADHAYIL